MDRVTFMSINKINNQLIKINNAIAFCSLTGVIKYPCTVFPTHISASDLDCLCTHATTDNGKGEDICHLIYFSLHYVYKVNAGYALTLVN